MSGNFDTQLVSTIIGVQSGIVTFLTIPKWKYRIPALLILLVTVVLAMYFPMKTQMYFQNGSRQLESIIKVAIPDKLPFEIPIKLPRNICDQCDERDSVFLSFVSQNSKSVVLKLKNNSSRNVSIRLINNISLDGGEKAILLYTSAIKFKQWPGTFSPKTRVANCKKGNIGTYLKQIRSSRSFSLALRRKRRNRTISKTADSLYVNVPLCMIFDGQKEGVVWNAQISL